MARREAAIDQRYGRVRDNGRAGVEMEIELLPVLADRQIELVADFTRAQAKPLIRGWDNERESRGAPQELVAGK